MKNYSKYYSKKKSKRQKRSIKNRNEGRKYIELLNLSHKHIKSDNLVNTFTKDDYLLLPYLKQGFKKGYSILKNKDIIKEINCHALCMTVSILNDIIGYKPYNKLYSYELLYLFFISYLIEDDQLTKKEASLKHALRKLELRIRQHTIRYERYKKEKGETHKETRRSLSMIQENLLKKEQLIKGKDMTGLKGLFRLDVCNNIDCEYLHEYKMEKSEKWNLSYQKFCSYIPELFKGIIWINMNKIFNRKSVFNIDFNLNIIPINLNIRHIFRNNPNVVLLPQKLMYNNMLFYNNKERDQSLLKDMKNNKFWVYVYDKNPLFLKPEKIPINSLYNKHYVVAQLNFDYNWRNSTEEKQMEVYENFNNFIQGPTTNMQSRTPDPVLKNIQKTPRKNRMGTIEYDLIENIENTNTIHWLYMHRDRMNNYIKEV